MPRGNPSPLHVAFAQFEQDNTIENTMAGLASAKMRGWIGGRRRRMDEAMKIKAIGLRIEAEQPVAEICRALGVSRATFHRHAGS